MIDRRDDSFGVLDKNITKLTSVSQLRKDHSLPQECPQSEPSINHIQSKTEEGNLRDYLGDQKIDSQLRGNRNIMLIDGDQNMYGTNESSTTTQLIQLNNGDFVDSCSDEEESIKVDDTLIQNQIILASSNEIIISRKESNTNNTTSDKNKMNPRIFNLRKPNRSSEENTVVHNINTNIIRGINIGINTNDNYTSTFPSIVNRKTSEDIGRTKRKIRELNNFDPKINIK